MGKKIIKTILIILLIIIFIVVALLAFLTFTEYKPAEKEEVPITNINDENDNHKRNIDSSSLSILSWNIGYGGLGKNAQFILDGGKGNGTPSDVDAKSYLEQIRAVIEEQNADVNILQEVDVDSSRSYNVNQAADIAGVLAGSQYAHALNYSCKFVPFPWPPIGKVNSGIETISRVGLEDATRISLPCPFNWPMRTANLKRCLLITHIKTPKGTLALINLHLEAYDDGEGKAAQTQQLLEVMQEEYEQGNYVIAGGDWNQAFPGSLENYPIKDSSTWTPGVLDEGTLPAGWHFVYDTSTPSCRLLNQPLNENEDLQQYYLIDGFVVSPNVRVESIKNLDLGFQASDHNPVRLEVDLK